jgi:hypothetical protein
VLGRAQRLVLLAKLPQASVPKPRQAPHATRLSEGERSRENHQEWKEAERDEPEDAMTRLVGVRRIDAVVGQRLPDEWNMNEQEHEGGQSEQDDSGGPTFARAYESERKEDWEHDPGRGDPLHDPGRHGEDQTEKREAKQEPLPGERVIDLRRLPLTSSHDGKGNHENNDSDDAEDVGRDRDRTGDVARIGPDETDDRSDDEHRDHHGQPVQNPSSGNDAEATPPRSSANRFAFIVAHRAVRGATWTPF